MKHFKGKIQFNTAHLVGVNSYGTVHDYMYTLHHTYGVEFDEYRQQYKTSGGSYFTVEQMRGYYDKGYIKIIK
tara:strand:+ start:63 stop:281 length:219 start_codon:yes stop_codon:yes gene_type:complete